MPPKRKPDGDPPLNESSHQPKRPHTVRRQRLTHTSVPDTVHLKWNNSTSPPGREAQKMIPLLSPASLLAAVSATTPALPLPPVLAQSIAPSVGRKA